MKHKEEAPDPRGKKKFYPLILKKIEDRRDGGGWGNVGPGKI